MAHKRRELVIGLVGNPNCGKTTIFNALTGARQKVANWSGVTVEKREGRIRRGDYTIRVIDLPGIYSLTSYSMEEIVTRDFILNERPDAIINVVDAGNLERNLYLTTQLINIGARAVLALNMIDEAEARGISIDTERLGTLLGMPVVKTIGTKSAGINEMIDAAIQVFEHTDEKSRQIYIPYGQDIEDEISAIRQVIHKEPSIGRQYSTRWLAVRLLERDADVEKKLSGYPTYAEIARRSDESRQTLEKMLNDDIETIIADRRYGFIAGAIRESVRKAPLDRIDLSERIDRVITNRYLGFPILFFFMWILFHLTFALGESPMRLLQQGVALLSSSTENLMPPGPLKSLIIDGIIGGVGGVIVFLPNILILFMGISFMEDTGYMARAAFVMDKIMHIMGLHGKSFIPLVMGFGCNVPAIMATRSLENRQDRILTILINPFMSCSARLPVYLLFAGIFFREHAGTVILSLYIIGLLLALASARLFKRLFFKGISTPFVMELPPYRIPTLKSTLLHMWDRASQYLRKMGGIILAFSIIIWALGEYPKSPEMERSYNARLALLESAHERNVKDRSHALSELKILDERYTAERNALLLEKMAREKESTFIVRFGKAIHPVLQPLGFNWQMGVSLLTGFVAKEIVVSTMGVIYHSTAEDDPHYTQRPMAGVLRQAEFGITPLVAYTFLLFVLLYVPCLATIVVIGKEAGWGWAGFSIAYQLAVAWAVCFLFYTGGRLLGL